MKGQQGNKITSRIWLKAFMTTLRENENKIDYSTDTKWTESMESIMKEVGAKLGCGVSCKDPKKEEGEEYLGIDFMFFYKKDYDEDRYVFPIVVVEHENSDREALVKYALWKILCVRSSVQVLICYRNNKTKIEILRQHLEDVILQGNLMKETDSELIVLIGDDSVDDEVAWEDYYSCFAWQNNKLKKIAY